jgi:hypothetical protein
MFKTPDWVWELRDRVFPLERPLAPEERLAQEHAISSRLAGREQRICSVAGNPDVVGPCLTALKTLLDEEDARRQSVDTRLTSIVGLSSIAGTIAFGSLLAQAGTTHATMILRWLLAIGSFYLTLQICGAILASIRGLQRRAYVVLDPDDVLPSDGEAPAHHACRQMTECVRALTQNQEENNHKVTQMALAHLALRNLLWGLLFLAVLVSSYSVTASGDDAFVERLKTNHELQEILRGPQGTQGPPGPTGQPGPTVSPARSGQTSRPVK